MQPITSDLTYYTSGRAYIDHLTGRPDEGPEIQQIFQQLRDGGFSVREIATRLGLRSTSAVQYRFSGKYKWTQEDLATVEAMQR